MKNILLKKMEQISVGEDDCQATITVSRGKDLINETRKAMMKSIKEVEQTEEKEKVEKKEPNGESRIQYFYSLVSCPIPCISHSACIFS